jgi:hypothetical protein
VRSEATAAARCAGCGLRLFRPEVMEAVEWPKATEAVDGRNATQVVRPVLFMDTDASKEKEEGAARVVDDAMDLCAQARVDDVEFEAVEGDGGGAKRGTTRGSWRWRCRFGFHHHDLEQQRQPDSDGLRSGPNRPRSGPDCFF